MNFGSQHFLITGGSSGIGLALAHQCAAGGGKLSLIARDVPRLNAARAEILARTPAASVSVFSADVSVEAEVLLAIAGAEKGHGKVDVLIANAGIARPGYFEEIPVSVFERTMAVNYFGALYPVKALLPGMRMRKRGAVIFISSGVGLVGLFGYSAYAPSKFALRGLAESLRGELKSSGVHVMIVYPPDTDTPQLREENVTKPIETKALTAGAGLWTAEAVALATLRGLERRKFLIAPGIPLKLLAIFHSSLAPILNWHFDRVAARALRDAKGE